MKKIFLGNFKKMTKIIKKQSSFNFFLEQTKIEEIQKNNLKLAKEKLKSFQVKKVDNLLFNLQKLSDLEIFYVLKKLLKKKEEIPIIKIDKNLETYLNQNNIEELKLEKKELKNCLENEKIKNLLNFNFGGNSNSTEVQEVEKEVVEEQTIFDVSVTSIDAKLKLKIIKEIKSFMGIGLKDAKDLVEKPPFPLKEGIKKEESEELKAKFEKIGCVVEIK